MGKIIIDDIATNEAAWLEQKKHGVGSGDIATIVGANSRMTPLRLWAIKTGREKPDEENIHMWWGKREEANIAALFAKQENYIARHANAMYVHEDVPFAQASPDYFATPAQTEIQPESAIVEKLTFGGAPEIIVECKNVGWRMKRHWADGALPLYVQMQVHWQMGIVGYEQAAVAPLIGGDITDFQPRYMQYDKTIFEQLLELASKFMWYVKNDVPPAAKGEDTKLVDTLIGALEDKTVEIADTPENTLVAQRYLAAEQERKDLESKAKALKLQQDEYKNILRQSMGNASRATLGNYLITAKTVNRKEYVSKATSFTNFNLITLKTEDGNVGNEQIASGASH